MTDEADIGSGERDPAQIETDEMIRQIPPLPDAGRGQPGAGQLGGGARLGTGRPVPDQAS